MKHLFWMLLLALPLIAEETPKKETAECKDHSAMMQETKARNSRLNGLLASMNKATGQKKSDYMADILRELLSERGAMQQHMACMMEKHKDKMEKMQGCDSMKSGGDTKKMSEEAKTDTEKKTQPPHH
ncbi:MAG: hypothetical protein K8S54_02235 [Spirochaetia bacterium]|nr:hypothetical protein [Spirochaetia bacterium]